MASAAPAPTARTRTLARSAAVLRPLAAFLPATVFAIPFLLARPALATLALTTAVPAARATKAAFGAPFASNGSALWFTG